MLEEHLSSLPSRVDEAENRLKRRCRCSGNGDMRGGSFAHASIEHALEVDRASGQQKLVRSQLAAVHLEGHASAREVGSTFICRYCEGGREVSPEQALIPRNRHSHEAPDELDAHLASLVGKGHCGVQVSVP